jgi:hypothetical protein
VPPPRESVVAAFVDRAEPKLSHAPIQIALRSSSSI